MVGAGEGFVKDAEMAPERARAVDEKRSVDSPREVGDWHILREELIVAVFEVVHWMNFRFYHSAAPRINGRAGALRPALLQRNGSRHDEVFRVGRRRRLLAHDRH